jgi:hypothetical protein
MPIFKRDDVELYYEEHGAGFPLLRIAAQCRERIERYRSAGLDLPIVSPRVGGSDPARAVMDLIRACAP